MTDPAIQPAAEPAAPSFAAFEATENAKALGEAPPVASAVPVAADPEADELDEPAAAVVADAPAVPVVEAKPAAEPVKAVSKRQQHLNDLERRAKIAELNAAELATKFAALEARTAKPAEEPKPEPKAAPVIDPKDLKPVEADFDDYADFVDARARWNYRQAKREEAAEAQKADDDKRQTEIAEEFQARRTTWNTRITSFLAKRPERTDALNAFLGKLHAGTPIGDALMLSEVGPEMADHLESHLDEAERIARLAPVQQFLALGKLEATLTQPTHASARAQPAAKTVTTAPAPLTTLAARSASPGDPSRAALDAGDFSAFEEAENRKALAAAR